MTRPRLSYKEQRLPWEIQYDPAFSSLLVRNGFMLTQNRDICWPEETVIEIN